MRTAIALASNAAGAANWALMVVQAGALRETLPADDRARPMLDSMADTGRQALAEMRRVLDLLRVGDGAERAPQPSVEQIEGLVTLMRTAGLLVELTVDGTPRPVPIAVGVSAYYNALLAPALLTRLGFVLGPRVERDRGHGHCRSDLSHPASYPRATPTGRP